jgi:hypothetical protein
VTLTEGRGFELKTQKGQVFRQNKISEGTKKKLKKKEKLHLKLLNFQSHIKKTSS